MLRHFFDPTTREPKPAFWGAIGVLILLMGLWAFIANLDAWLAGRRFASSNSRRGGARMPSDIATVVSLIFASGGAMTVWIAISHAFPEFAARKRVQEMAGWITLALVAWIAVLGALVGANRMLR